jgi:hypothetical protein
VVAGSVELAGFGLDLAVEGARTTAAPDTLIFNDRLSFGRNDVGHGVV